MFWKFSSFSLSGLPSLISFPQLTKRARSGRKREKALSRLRSRLSRDGQSANSEKLQEDIIDFIMGAGGETSLNLPCFLILAPHLSCHLAFPLLCVRAAGDEGDPV